MTPAEINSFVKNRMAEYIQASDRSAKPKTYIVRYFEGGSYFGLDLKRLSISAHTPIEAIYKFYLYIEHNLKQISDKAGIYTIKNAFQTCFYELVEDLDDTSKIHNWDWDRIFNEICRDCFDNDTLWFKETRSTLISL